MIKLLFLTIPTLKTKTPRKTTKLKDGAMLSFGMNPAYVTSETPILPVTVPVTLFPVSVAINNTCVQLSTSSAAGWLPGETRSQCKFSWDLPLPTCSVPTPLFFNVLCKSFLTRVSGAVDCFCRHLNCK